MICLQSVRPRLKLQTSRPGIHLLLELLESRDMPSFVTPVIHFLQMDPVEPVIVDLNGDVPPDLAVAGFSVERLLGADAT